jgi:hypothetical protein
MPPILPWIIAGAGAVAGARWVSKQLAARSAQARTAAEGSRRRAASEARTPRDLGKLEFDEAANVYRPRNVRST